MSVEFRCPQETTPSDAQFLRSGSSLPDETVSHADYALLFPSLLLSKPHFTKGKSKNSNNREESQVSAGAKIQYHELIISRL